MLVHLMSSRELWVEETSSRWGATGSTGRVVKQMGWENVPGPMALTACTLILVEKHLFDTWFDDYR